MPTYSDADLLVANTNPIVLDSAGRASIFLDAATYNFVLAPPTDTDPPTSPVWSVDNVASAAAFGAQFDITAIAGETIAAGDVVYMSQGRGGLTIGRWYKADADLEYASANAALLGVAPVAMSFGEVGTVRLQGRVGGLSGLIPGFRYYVSLTAGGVTATQLQNQRLIGYADSTDSLVLTPAPLQFRSLNVTFGAPGGGVLTTGVKHYIYLPYPILILGWTLMAEQVGSIVIDVWTSTYGTFPPTAPGSIAGTAKPTLTAAQSAQNVSLATWGVFAIPRGNVLAFNIDSVATINYASLMLEFLTV